MTTAQLSRLRPQINALSSLFEDPQSYIAGLTAMLNKYRNEADYSPTGITAHSLIARMNIPDIVITQLGISFNHLVKVYSDQAISIANQLWEKEYFEYKQLSILLLSKLPPERIEHFFNFITTQVHNESETPIFSASINAAHSVPIIRTDKRWHDLVLAWASANEVYIKKIGLQAIAELVSMDSNYPLPELLKSIKPIFIDPNITIRSELLDLVKSLIALSSNETAAFLISLSIQNPKPEMDKFVRKCLPFFPDSLAEKIKGSINSSFS